MKRKVSFVRIHDIKVVHPKAGQLPDSMPSPSKTLPGLEMYLEDGVLEITIAGVSAGIPTSNIQYMQFEGPAAASIKPKA